ncbi:MAG: hypothetical protein QOH57_3784 [Mycobacterium sp.]|nr:hypothetical protein [Mycobacterium sp.]
MDVDAAVDTVEERGPAAAEPEKPQHRRHPLVAWAWGLVRLNFIGVATGALFFCLSMTPSLLPRDYMFQGVIGGICASIGYGIGAVIGKHARRFLHRRHWWPGRRVSYWLKVVTVVGSLTASVLVVIPSAAWQRQVSDLMGMEGPSTVGWMRTLLVALLSGGVLVGVARVMLDAAKTIARYFIRRWHVHEEVALFIGSAIVVALIILLVNGVLVRGFISGASAIFQPQNLSTRDGIQQPTQPERSGSPESSAPWESLGYQGRIFVATGPHADELTALNGRPAKEPIRIYAGLATAENDEARTDIISREMARTGALSRKVLVVVPTTGTGWVDPVAARSIEAMYNGDTAMVALQYSYLPSWISFIADKKRSMLSGKHLIDAVHDVWVKLPPDQRPKLVLYGESLGSMAGQGAFDFIHGIEDMGFSSVLWVGPPNSSPLWSALTARRDPGTPEIEPRYDNGRTVRFSLGYDIAGIAAPAWRGTRVLFLQHASDPIVWWSPSLLFDQPAWLKEPPGRDRTATMRWYPIVTFFQVAFDMTNAAGVPGGHGHNYGNTVLDGWVAVTPADGWTPQDTDRTRRWLERWESVGGPEF